MDSTSPVFAVAVEPGRLSAGLVGRRGEVLVRDRVSMPTRDVWRSLEGLVRRVQAAAAPSVGEFDVVSVSSTGPVDIHAGTVSPPHVPGWTSFPLVEHLHAATGRPVVLDSAGAAAVEAERWVGEADPGSSYASVVIDAVCDSGCVVRGRRMIGAHGNAGSLAHVIVEPGGRRSWTGIEGSLDPYVSAIALEAEMNRPLRRATDSIVERAGIMLGRAIASYTAMVDLDAVFVSGAVLDAFGDTLLGICRREVAARSKLPFLGAMQIVEPVEHISALQRAAALAASPHATPVTVE
ncbi:MAG: ROK family protein [Actinomycetota bacterium]